MFVCSFSHSSHSLLSASHISSSVVWGRLRAPCLRDLGALHRLYSMSFQSKSSCPFSPCWVQPVSFVSTLGYVMTKLTHLPWDGLALCHFWSVCLYTAKPCPLLLAQAKPPLDRQSHCPEQMPCATLGCVWMARKITALQGMGSVTSHSQESIFWCVPPLCLELDVPL